MIYIIDNREKYSAYEINFVEIPKEMEEEFSFEKYK